MGMMSAVPIDTRVNRNTLNTMRLSVKARLSLPINTSREPKMRPHLTPKKSTICPKRTAYTEEANPSNP